MTLPLSLPQLSPESSLAASSITINRQHAMAVLLWEQEDVLQGPFGWYHNQATPRDEMSLAPISPINFSSFELSSRPLCFGQ